MITMVKSLALGLASVLALTNCRGQVLAPLRDGVQLVADVDSVSAILTAEGWLSGRVPFQLVNASSQTIGLRGCRGPHRPAIEFHLDTGWVEQERTELMCDEAPTYLAPGETRRDTLHLGGCYQRVNCSPQWLGDTSATVRLVWEVYPVQRRVAWSSELLRLPSVSVYSEPIVARLIRSP